MCLKKCGIFIYLLKPEHIYLKMKLELVFDKSELPNESYYWFSVIHFF